MAQVQEMIFTGGTKADLKECKTRLAALVEKHGSLDKLVGWVVTSTRSIPVGDQGKEGAAAMLRVIAD